jgi:hypothetical protein
MESETSSSSEHAMAPSLHVFWGPLAGTVISLSDRPVLLGRSPECDVVIAYSAVSRRHALIRREDGAHVIEDLHSRSGTQVNTQAISIPTRLRNNDRIRICDFIAVYAERPLTEAEWLNGTEPALMLPALWANTSARKGRLFAVACCRHFWTALRDSRSQKAVEIAEQYADQLVGEDERQRAEADVREVQAGIRQAMWSPSVDLEAGSHVGGLDRDLVFAQFAEWAVSRRSFDPRDANGRIPAGFSQEGEGEDVFFTPLLREVFGNPFRPASIDPLWRTPDVIALADSAYQCRRLPIGTLDRAHLGILADALEEAGCTEPAILEHLRGPGRHVRGCWALDLVRSVA